eukprot:14528686-Alexandrium_andersonii.AAC.1
MPYERAHGPHTETRAESTSRALASASWSATRMTPNAKPGPREQASVMTGECPRRASVRHSCASRQATAHTRHACRALGIGRRHTKAHARTHHTNRHAHLSHKRGHANAEGESMLTAVRPATQPDAEEASAGWS